MPNNQDLRTLTLPLEGRGNVSFTGEWRNTEFKVFQILTPGVYLSPQETMAIEHQANEWCSQYEMYDAEKTQ